MNGQRPVTIHLEKGENFTEVLQAVWEMVHGFTDHVIVSPANEAATKALGITCRVDPQESDRRILFVQKEVQHADGNTGE